MMEEQTMTTNDCAWIEVFSGEAFEAEVIKGLLESNDIRCILEDHTLSAVTSHYNGIGGYVSILVNPADEEKARQLIMPKE